jgi:DNA-binding CsgD family transcriptional regulator
LCQRRATATSFHLKHIYEKLHEHSRTDAVAMALRERLV